MKAVIETRDVCLALRADGTVTAWGRNDVGQTNVPNGLTNVIAIAACGNQSMALRSNGTVTNWGSMSGTIPAGLTNATVIACGTNFSLALRSNGLVVAWGNNGSGQTNVPANLSNVVAIAAGGTHALALRKDGQMVAWGNNSSGQTNVPPGLSNVMAVAAGWAHSLALKNDGTVVCWGENSNGQTNAPSALANVKLLAAGGNHTLAAVFSPLVQYPVDVSKDLLLIYNTNSLDSSNVCAYYLAHRPMVSGANVLGIGCTNAEIITSAGFTNQILTPYLGWLQQNPTKHPQYLVPFLDIPSRVHDGTNVYASVFCQLREKTPGIPPFVTCINMGSTNYGAASRTNDTVAYINKLAWCGSNYSPGQLILSASKGLYGNTNYVVDNVRAFDFKGDGSTVYTATNGLLAAGVSPLSILYSGTNQPCLGFDTNNLCTNQLQLPQYQLTNATDVAGYISWGAHSTWLGGYYAVDSNKVKWTGNSRWWIIHTIESYNGVLQWPQLGHFPQWFSPSAFGGTNYSNTPVGAVTHVDEPTLPGVNDSYKYFNLWARGKNFAISAWNSRLTDKFQAVGDPFVTN